MAEEKLILVDEANRAIGADGKMAVHRAGALHRAFSIFIIDKRGRILLQQRAAQKYHSGELWANSCCGHPRPGERTVSAARRRLNEELGLTLPLTFGFFARYQGELGRGLTENEFVYVYFGMLRGDPKPDPAEVEAIEFASVTEINRRIGRSPDMFAYWLQHYFHNHLRVITRCATEMAQASSRR